MAHKLEKLLTLKEIASDTGISLEQLRLLVVDGALPAINIGNGEKNKSWRVKRSDWEAWLESRTNKPAAKPVEATRRNMRPNVLGV